MKKEKINVKEFVGTQVLGTLLDTLIYHIEEAGRMSTQGDKDAYSDALKDVQHYARETANILAGREEELTAVL